MKKLLKLFIILVIMIAFSMNLTVFAAEEKSETTENNISESTTIDETQTTTTANNSTNNSSAVNVKTVASTNENELGISDILNILLIATGIVIILLAIAIFIKLK